MKVDFGIVLRLHITVMQLFGCQCSGMSDPSSLFEGHCGSISTFSFTKNMGTRFRVTRSQAEMIFALQSLLNQMDRKATILVRHRRCLYFTTHSLSQTMIHLFDGGRCT